MIDKQKLKNIILKLPIGTLRSYIGTEIALGFIERVLTRADVRQVYYLIENDIYNIFSLYNPKSDKLKRALETAKKIIKDNKDIVERAVTVEAVTNILRETRPDILSLIINHPKGRDWLKK